MFSPTGLLPVCLSDVRIPEWGTGFLPGWAGCMLCNVVKNWHRLWWMPTGLLRLIPKPLEREVLAGLVLAVCVVIKIGDNEAGFGCDICELTRVFA